jgi:toxin ParE1/3/4
MSRFVLSPRARGDLDGIWTFTARKWGVSQAEQYVRRVAEAVDLIAETPTPGHRSKRRRQPEFGKIDAKQRASAHAHERSECVSALGRDCGDIREGYRKYPVGSHMLFYRLITDGIDVVRILHRQMDFDRYLP